MSYIVRNKYDNQRIKKKWKNKQSGYRPRVCQYGDIWTPDKYPSKVRRDVKNNEIRKYYAEWIDCELDRDWDEEIILIHIDYDNIPIWKCKMCTYDNIEKLAFCSICNHPYNFNNNVVTNIDNIGNDIAVNYYETQQKHKKLRRKRRRKRRKNHKNKADDFEKYWNNMKKIKKYQPTNYAEYEKNTRVEKKMYIYKILVYCYYYYVPSRFDPKYKYNVLFDDKIQSPSLSSFGLKVKGIQKFKNDQYGDNNYYDLKHIKDIPVLFITEAYDILFKAKKLNDARDAVYDIVRQHFRNDQVLTNTSGVDEEDDKNTTRNTVFHFNQDNVELNHSAKYYTQLSREQEQLKHAYRQQFKNNAHNMDIKVIFELNNECVNCITVNIHIIDENRYLEYECKYSCIPALNSLKVPKLTFFDISQKCFLCSEEFNNKCTVVWSKKNVYRLYAIGDCNDNNIENILYKYIPHMDIIHNILFEYLNYDSLLVVYGKVNKSWINFMDGKTKTNILRYHNTFNVNQHKMILFAFKDTKGNIRYYRGETKLWDVVIEKKNDEYDGNHIDGVYSQYNDDSSDPCPRLFSDDTSESNTDHDY